jgi:hypothetical protein
VLLCNEAKVVLDIVGNEYFHSDVGIARPTGVAKYTAFVAAVDVQGKVRTEEHKGLGMSQFLPTILGIKAVVFEKANFTGDFPNDLIFLHSVLGLQDLPSRLRAAHLGPGLGDNVGGQIWPTRSI